MFKRRKGGADDGSVAEEQVETVETVGEDAVEPVGDAGAPGQGPFDIASAPQDDVPRVDLGGLQIPIVDNMQLTLEGHNEEANTFALAVVVLEAQQAALQLMAVAAPRSGGYWAEVVDELESEITQAGGSVRRGQGRFGEELIGEVPAADPEGNTVMQPARFVGAEGNRWFIRGMFMGTAATSTGMGEFFEDIIAGCIVNRGERPMAPGDLIALSPPEGIEPDVEQEDADGGAYEDMEPFERGPEITETR